MLLKKLSFLSTALSLFSPVHGAPAPEPNGKRAALDDWIAGQSSVALTGILSNVGPNGATSYGAAPGLVLASPSTVDPDYFFYWTRDAALTFKALVDYFIKTGDTTVQIEINDYITAQAKLQTVDSLSGSFADGSGLGEPKYNPNGTAFSGPWSRPQRDGPALRATALIAYGRWLQSNGHPSAASDIIWPIVKNDLQFIGQYWNKTGADLWEETFGSSFFTSAAQHRALVEGSAFAASVGDSCSNCDSQAPQLLCFLQQYWNGDFIVSNLNVENYRSGKDANSILSTIQTYDPEAGCDDTTFQPCSARMLANHKAVVDSFRKIYGVNNGISQGAAVAVGRYSEDVYFNGNPWYLATLAAAEQLYYSLYQYNKWGSITITSTSLPFWQAIYPRAATGLYKSDSTTYASLASAMKTYADGFVAIVQKYTPSNGALAEQFNRDTGTPLSARDLTWSYAAFLTMAAARDNSVLASWGAADAKNVPNVCTSSSATGTYKALTSIEWPKFDCKSAASIQTTFNVLASTMVGQSIYVVGSIDALGSWNTAKAVLLSADRYRDNMHLWYGSVTLDPGTQFTYKYIRKNGDGKVVWESDPNREFTVPQGCRNSAAVKDEWR